LVQSLAKTKLPGIMQSAKHITLAAILSGFFVSSPAFDLKMDTTLGKNTGEIQLGPVTAYPSMKIIKYSQKIYMGFYRGTRCQTCFARQYQKADTGL